MTTKQAAPATLDQAQTWIDALRYDLGDAQNECIKVRADNKRLMAEREQLVAALRELLDAAVSSKRGHIQPRSLIDREMRALLRQIEGEK